MTTHRIAPPRAAATAIAVAVASLIASPGQANQGVAEPPTIITFESGSPRVLEQASLKAEQLDSLRDSGAHADLSPIATAIRDIAPKGAIRNAYADAGFEPIWSVRDASGQRRWNKAEAMFAATDVADAHAAPGMSAISWRLRDRLIGADALSTEEAAALDIAVSRAFLQFAEKLHGGAIDPSSASKDIDVARPLLDFASALRVARDAADMRAAFEQLTPQTAEYASLKRLYAQLRDTAANGDWGVAPEFDGAIRPMDRGPVISALRTRLIALGDLDPAAPQSRDPETGEAVYDGVLQQAVMNFQARHGLVADGVVGENTLAELRMSAAERARQVAVNMERARWLNKTLGHRHIKVNIADFRVRVIEADRPIYESAVVVGKARKHQTPEFSDEMTHVVVNPKWHVPYSIATKELLPVFQNDPGEVYRRNMQVLLPGAGFVDPYMVDWTELSQGYFPYQIQQRSGPGNALGDVKFIFPNEHAVYLHDTPAKSLFSKPVRAFSHGCVRVAQAAPRTG